MKKLFTFIALLISLSGFSQIHWNKIYSYNEYLGLRADSALVPPGDTLASAPILSLAIKNNHVYQKLSTGIWSQVDGGGNAVQSLTGSQSIQYGAFNSMPSPGTSGRFYAATDSSRWYFDNGVAWLNLSGSGGGSGGAVLTFGTGLVAGTYNGSTPVSVIVDTNFMSTRQWRQKGMDSLGAVKQNLLTGPGYVKMVSGSPTYLTPTQVTADLNTFTPSLNGLVPAPSSVAGKVLSDNGTWITAGSGGGQLGTNPIADSLGNAGVMAVRVQNVANDNNNPCYWCDIALNNIRAKLAYTRNNYSAPNDSVKASICIGPGMHSFGDKFEIWQKNLVDNILNRNLPMAGPGFFGGDMTNYNFTCTVGWTVQSLNTNNGPNMGPDGKRLVSVTGQTVTIQTGVAIPSSYTQWQDVIELWYDSTGGGTATNKIDGVTIDTVNCSGTPGLQVHRIHASTYTTHTLQISELTPGTTHCIFLGAFLYTSNIRGIIVNKMALGSTDITEWYAQNSALFVQELSVINPDLILHDLNVNNEAHNIDTNVVKTETDTLIGRYRAANPYVSIILLKGTQFSQSRYGVPAIQLPAYKRTDDYLVRKDSVASFDEDLILGPFPQSLATGMLNAGDSLHGTSQFGYAAATDLLNNIGAFAVDPGPQLPNFYSYNSDTTTVGGVVSPIVVSQNANKVTKWSTALNWSNFNGGWWEWKSSTGGSLRIDPTPGSGQTTFTGPSSSFNFNGANVQTDHVFTSTLAANNSFSGTISVGSGGQLTGGVDISLNKLSSTASPSWFKIKHAAPGQYAYITMDNDIGNGFQFIVPGSTSSLGAPFVNGTCQIFGNQGGLYLWNRTSNILSFGTNGTERAQFTAGGNFLIGTSTNVPSSLFTMSSTTQGFLPPVMTTSQFGAISSPATSLHAVLSDSSGKLALYNGSKIITYATTDQLPASGSYTPTIGTNLNITSVSVLSAYYTRIGNIVHVRVAFTCAPTSTSAQTQITFSLPFTPNAGSDQNIGIATAPAVNSAGGSLAGQVFFSGSNGTVIWTSAPSASSSQTVIAMMDFTL